MRTPINIALIVALIVAAPIIGLYVSVGLYLFLHMTLLGIRPIPVALPVAVCAMLVMYGFFGMLLGVEMRGVLLF